jgi:hypothetical protein
MVCFVASRPRKDAASTTLRQNVSRRSISSMPSLFAWRHFFHPRGLVNDGPSGHRRRRRAMRVVDKTARVKHAPPCETKGEFRLGGTTEAQGMNRKRIDSLLDRPKCAGFLSPKVRASACRPSNGSRFRTRPKARGRPAQRFDMTRHAHFPGTTPKGFFYSPRKVLSEKGNSCYGVDWTRLRGKQA